ncbi:MAG: HAMP domain-containing histidine kinase [Chloroflexi bacterium]|jgi:signal transduction histidine kinase|nr:HAMP domain-containing histidine kinase [Chloroflexota bacterium]MBT4514736.1 HAMP domain-containing histidine kinase [Chloroflexota bacterium]MBT6680990.1 HAMP domain-containing histidine kinase [Chloroflexota bacterium]
MPRWARSLQFKLTLGFTLILAGALLSVSAFTYATTERKIDAFSDEISVARGERLDHVVSESYNENDSWEGVQDAIVQVSRLYDWRIVIEDEGGLIVGDSHSAFDRNPLVSSFFFRRPVVVGGVQMGNFFIETGDGFVAPPGDRSSFIRELERQQNKLSVDDDDHDDDDDGALRRPAGNKTAPAPPVELATEPQLSELASSFNRSLLWSGFASAFAGIGLVAFTTRRALAPVHQLSAAAAGVAHGDLSQRVEADPGSELGDLGIAFNEMAGALEDAEAERRRLVADIAHELRSPLTNIQGYLEAIKDGVLDADDATIDTIYSQTKHLGALVEDLRLLALVEAGSLRLELTATNLADLVKDASEAFRPRAIERSVTLDVSASEGMPDARLDPTRIRQVVSNLVENAITHTPDGGRVAVTVDLVDDTNSAVVMVSDTGTGISPDDLPHVFDRFYRVDPSRNRVTGGAGLGLTIVKRLVEVHGGRIEVDSELGSGTTFTVEIPFSGPASDA